MQIVVFFLFFGGAARHTFPRLTMVVRGHLGWHSHCEGRAAEKQKEQSRGVAYYKQATPTAYGVLSHQDG